MALDTTNSNELTADQVLAILTKPLETASQFLATIPGGNIHDVNGRIRIPGAPAPAPEKLQWVGENEKIPEYDTEFSELSLLPDTMKSVKSITRYSNELARQAVVSLDQALKSRLVADHAAKIDAQFLGATGDGVTLPRGMGAWTGVQTQNVTGNLTLDALMDALFMVQGTTGNPETVTMYVNPVDYKPVRAAKDNDGRYMLQPDATRGGLVIPALGVQTVMDKSVKAGLVTIADTSHVHVARDLAPSVKILDQTYGDYDQQAIRVVTRYDMGIDNPQAAIRIKLTAAG